MSDVPDADKAAGAGPCPAKAPWYIRCKGPLIIFAIIVAFIFIKWLYLRSQYGASGVAANDPMNVKVLDVPYLENCCSWWPISHFILFFILGYFFPECWGYLIFFGILWELFEVVMFYVTSQETQVVRTADRRIEYTNNWWAGSYKDVLMNTLGATGGYLTRKLVEAGLGETRDECGNVIPGKTNYSFTLSL